ncbi:MAG: transketolase [Clostridia bacterium]
MTNKCVNELRVVSAEIIEKAKSGHTGVALGGAAIMYALFADHLSFDKTNPQNPLRDRFILSAGHASALLYATLNLFGLGITKDDLLKFRQLGSKTPGHPELSSTPFVDASTGPLGQGVAMGVGMAIAEEYSRARSGKGPVFTYVFAGDGCLMEGVANEAISLAGTLKLERLILLYDYNQITIDGSLDISNKEHVKEKFVSQGWNVVEAKDGNDAESVSCAISQAKEVCGKPTLVICPTTIGYGSQYEGSSKIHGLALSPIEIIGLKETLNVTKKEFGFSEEILNHCIKHVNQRMQELPFMQISIEKQDDLCEWQNPNLEDKLENALQLENQAMSGRDASKILLNQIAKAFQGFIGGTADLASSVKAYITDGGDFSFENRKGRNIRFGVREHAMGSIANGIALFDGKKTFASTFLSFSNYMIPAIRMSAYMNLPVIYIFTHDSVLVGEDGPTHQPIEQIGMLRLIPNLNVFRPCDVTETRYAWKKALSSSGPSAIILSKQNMLPQDNSLNQVEKGGYIVKKVKEPKAVLIASGSEVELANMISALLENEHISVQVSSVPCVEDFEKQSIEYKNKVLCDKVPKFVFEASNDNIWYKYIAGNGMFFGINEFGKSGKGEDVYSLFFDKKNICEKIINYINNSKN